MKSLVLSRPALTEAYRRHPRPVVLKRMEHLARDVGNERLADLLAVEDLRARLAVLGYAVAFENLLTRPEEQGGGLPLSGSLALELYVDLFAPSLEGGIVEAEDLKGWRTAPVFIPDTLFVPPGPEKVPRMVELLFDELDEIEASKGLLRAILVHLWFVWIHPFPDGNGRVARFLMNAALLGGGLPWLTIRVEERSRYFAALRTAQLDDDYRPFARFVSESFLAQAAD